MTHARDLLLRGHPHRESHNIGGDDELDFPSASAGDHATLTNVLPTQHHSNADDHPEAHAHGSHSGIGAADHHAAFVQADHDALPNPHHSNASDHSNALDHANTLDHSNVLDHAEAHAHASHSGIGASDHHTSFVQADHDALANPHHSNANDHVASHTLASHSARAHSDLTGIGASDHHSNANDHANTLDHAQDHASRHQPGGADAMAVDAAVGTGSLRTLGSGAQQAAAGTHTHPGGSEAFPIDAVFLAVVSTNPATLLGYGTWSQIAGGRVLVGQTGGDTDFDTAEETGGEKTHTLVTAELPVHNHQIRRERSATTGSATTQIARTADTTSTVDEAVFSENTGSGTAHQNMPPYFVVYIWKRTA
ncbi:MAG: hypothetical protein HY323_08135 [Betaproteobacteria bacterium]|nr:hypothetical protein [Betaproteobacteria bacterium]